MKRENVESEISSSNSSSSGSSSSSDSNDKNSAIEDHKLDRNSESRIEDSLDTESYFSANDLDVNSEIIRSEPQQMEVDVAEVRKIEKQVRNIRSKGY